MLWVVSALMATQDRPSSTASAPSPRRWRPRPADGVALAAALIVLGPALQPGYVLLRDMMFVPDPVWSPRLLGLTGETPRGVPSDLAVYLAALVVPAWVVQKVALLGALVLAGSGAARLAGSAGRLAAVTAAIAAIWNPWVGERLLMGHWAVLLGYAAVPWIALLAVRRLRDGGPWPGLAAAISLAGLMGASAQVLATLVLGGAVVAAGLGPDRVGARILWRRAWGPLMLHGLWAVPWAAPSLLGTAQGSDPAGFGAFTPSSDTPFGVIVSVLTGGGIWNAAAVPAGRDSVAAVGAVMMTLLAGWALLTLGRRTPEVIALVVAAGMGLFLVGLTAGGPAQALLAGLPGGGLLRDATRQSGPWVLAVAVGLGLAAGRVGAPAWGHVRWLLPALPILTLPLLAGGVGGALRPVDVPGGLSVVAQAVACTPAAGPACASDPRVVVLPFRTTRNYAWNADRPSLSPWSRLVRGEVIESGALVIDVGLDQVVVAAEDPRNVPVQAALGSTDPVSALARLGVGWVIIDDPDLAAPTGAVLVKQTAQARAFRLTPERAPTQGLPEPLTPQERRVVLVLDGAVLLGILVLAGGAFRGAKSHRKR